jgi:tetratricopeptide (TPR) repeat protein
MGSLLHICKYAVAVFALMVGYSLPLQAQAPDVQQLLADLANPETQNWQSIERKIRTEWSKSGSPSMDLLLQRGEKAMEAEDFDLALEHLTALTDHAPDFAEGWNARATVLFRKELYGPALEDLSRALALNPQHFGAMTGLAVILQDVGMLDEALEAWRLVEAANPHRPEVGQAIAVLEEMVAGQTL